MLANKLMGAGSAEKLYVDDVFSTYLYTGNGSTQTINNGIDLAGKGGMVWIKDRSAARSAAVADTLRGVTNVLYPDSAAAQQAANQIIGSIGSSGFSVGADFQANASGENYVSWTFRKAPKFFDVVTWIGDGVDRRSIPHSLGGDVGIYIIKPVSGSSSWALDWDVSGGHYIKLGSFYHGLKLNSDAAQAPNGYSFWGYPSNTDFRVRSDRTNIAGNQYVAYLFAHDTSTDGIIQCGSFTTDASGNASVTSIGWEPQFAMIKASSTTGDWIMLDSMRGWDMTASDAKLAANLNNAESLSEYGNPTATGFDFKGGAASSTYIFMAVRRSNKPPTTGVQVFAPKNVNGGAWNGSSSINTGANVFSAPDLIIDFPSRTSPTSPAWLWSDRLRGYNKTGFPVLDSSSEASEVVRTANPYRYRDEDYFYLSTGSGMSSLFFRRAPGFFDVVCYTGTGVTRTVAHNLGVVPELIIVKSRANGANAGALDWPVYSSKLGTTKFLYLNHNFVEQTQTGFWNDTAPTDTVFTVGSQALTNEASANFVAYLFATCPGISKIGSYTGNGTSQVIDCGFSTGARFVLLKCTNLDGDWIIFDSARGIVAANDPHLSLNTTAAEVTTDDSVDPDASGFIVNQNTATNINVSGGSYIFLAIA